MRSINRLNEEIARWAFEILFKKNTSWVISFTNPTAGPWKTIKATSMKTGKEGEVYRFILEEDRPDIVMYNDELKTTIIIEAKDSIEKLLDNKQAEKSAAVVVKLADLLNKKAGNEFWRGRENYKVVLGLLWGSTDYVETESEKNKLYDYYQKLVQGEPNVYTELVIGVETLYKNQSLSCSAFYKTYNSAAKPLGEVIVKSLMKR